MNASAADNPHLRVARAAVLAGVASIAVVGLAFGIAKAVGADLLAADIALVGGLMFLAGVPGLIGAALAAGRMRGGAVYGFLGGMVVRMPVGAGLALWGTGLAQSAHFTNCIAVAYIVLLAIEVLILAPAIKATAGIEPKRPLTDPAATHAALPKESV
ncbi:MAG: hypothetical protein AAGA29_09465 [Planctomycetota bacterium]